MGRFHKNGHISRLFFAFRKFDGSDLFKTHLLALFVDHNLSLFFLAHFFILFLLSLTESTLQTWRAGQHA